MTRMLTPEDISKMFEEDEAGVDSTLETLASVGLSMELAHAIWLMLADKFSATPEECAVCFMAGLLVAKTHAKLTTEGDS